MNWGSRGSADKPFFFHKSQSAELLVKDVA
jgi:hypothetical protein